jgi:polyisoprenyl-phosphate glycosyltransferase
MSIPDCSVIVPVFNSEKSLEELFQRIKKVMEDEGKSFEVIFVEDGGWDHSWDVLSSLKSAYPENVYAIRLSKNYGQHNATFCGFTFAKGDLIITIDDDLQNPPEEITKLFRHEENTNADLVYGIYHKKQHSFLRNVASKSLKTAAKVFLDRPGQGSSFRLIKRGLLDKLLEHSNNFIFIDEIFNWYTDEIEFVFVQHLKRPSSSKSGYSAGKLIKIAYDLMFYYTNIPLKLMVYGGLIVSVISFLLGVQFMLRKLFFNIPLGYTSLIVTILFSTSIIVFSLGVIGGYLSRIYHVQNKKPPFNIRKVL